MSVLDEDPDDVFMKIMEGVDLAEPVAVDYTQLSDAELSVERARVHSELVESGEMHTKNPLGRAADLHSQFAAIMSVMQSRRLSDT